jgi:hypothetical protein
VSPNGGLKAAPSPPQKQHSEHTRQKAKRGELNGLVVHVDVRIGLALYGSSCGPRCELNLFFGGNKKSVEGEKNTHKKFRKDSIQGSPEGTSQLRVPICGGMSTADAHSA